MALRHGANVLSYRELNRRSLLLASKLRALGVQKGSTVAICADRSIEQIIGALGSMLAGAAYLPIDPASPGARIEAILGDSGASALIASVELLSRFSTPAILIDVAEPIEELKTAAAGLLSAPEFSANDLAYVIYTSGSTGTPKGVEITHGNLNHLIAWHLEAFKITQSDRATHLAGVGFDAAVWETWPYLCAGAEVSIVSDDIRADPAALQRWLIEEGATISFLPTPLAEAIIAMEWPTGTRLRTLLTGGDILHKAPRHDLPFCVVNNYGPTECTVVATSGVVSPEQGGLPSIGRAIQGASVYVLNEEGEPVAANETGEIYIGGAGVGRGYRNQPEQTSRSFLKDPFSLIPGSRMYRTGDLAVVSPGGDLEFRGRADGQEKIRGNRVELDEVASVLDRHPSVAFSAVVASSGEPAEKHLIAYVLPAGGAKCYGGELRHFVAAYLPAYMIPAVYVRLDKIPLTLNGKVDKNSLPLASSENQLPEALLARAESPTESTVLALVRALLGREQIGVEDDFFLAGGHSLLGTQLVLRIRQRFGVKLTLRDLFESSTPAKLARRIEEMIMAEIESLSEQDVLRLGEERK